MGKPVYNSLDKMGLEQLAADPVSENFTGRVFYNTATQVMRVYNGTSWDDVGASGAVATPVGTIVPYNPGYYTDGTNGGFTAVGPAGNTEAQIKTYLASNEPQWWLCDGTAPIDGTSPIWNVAGRFVPKLNDSRFLRGAATAGGTGGSASITLIEANLPSHTHGVGNYALSDTDLTHDHNANTNASNNLSNHSHKLDNWNGAGSSALVSRVNHNLVYNVHNTANQNSQHNHNMITNVANALGNHNHNIASGDSGSTGSGTSFDITPVYLDTYFIIRIK